MLNPLEGSSLQERYRVEQLLGQGSMGDVYLAWEHAAERQVALKIARRGARASAMCFQREALVSERVRHPGLVQVFDHGHAEYRSGERLPYLSLELLSGQTLADHLAQQVQERRPIDLNFCIEIMVQAAEALAAAHQAGIVHRDIKPGNIFVSSYGERPKVCVFDFGLAHLSGELGAEEELLAGTIEYMAPEQVLTEAIDARADIYALGIVLFRLLTYELPFDEALQTELLAHHLMSPAPPPSWLLEGLPSSIETIVLTALRKHPENRYPNIQALLKDLVAVQQGEHELVQGMPLAFSPDSYAPSSSSGRRAFEQIKQLRDRPSYRPPRPSLTP